MRKIYVTGLGVISGIGQGVKENLDSLKSGKHGMGKITLFPTVLDVPVSEVKQSNEKLKQILFLPSGKTYSRTALLGLLAAQEAARDAELDFASPRIGLISSTSIGGMDASERFYASFREDNRKGRLRDIISHDCGASTEMIAAYLGVKGMVTTLSTACSSAANAIMLGARLIRHGSRRWNGCLMPFHAQRFQFIDDTGQRALPSFRPHTCRIKPRRRSRIPCSSIGEIPYKGSLL